MYKARKVPFLKPFCTYDASVCVCVCAHSFFIYFFFFFSSHFNVVECLYMYVYVVIVGGLSSFAFLSLQKSILIINIFWKNI